MSSVLGVCLYVLWDMRYLDNLDWVRCASCVEAGLMWLLFNACQLDAVDNVVCYVEDGMPVRSLLFSNEICDKVVQSLDSFCDFY